jgi:hypothetical protein
MNPLQVEHFLEVADEGSFKRAAKRVFRTQPAVSQSVKEPEETVASADGAAYPVCCSDWHPERTTNRSAIQTAAIGTANSAAAS